MAKYFCPECQTLTLRSNVYPGDVTVRRIPSYFDEDGDYHAEEVTNIMQYVCSKGHTWSSTVKS